MDTTSDFSQKIRFYKYIVDLCLFLRMHSLNLMFLFLNQNIHNKNKMEKENNHILTWKLFG